MFDGHAGLLAFFGDRAPLPLDDRGGSAEEETEAAHDGKTGAAGASSEAARARKAP
jgi:hypothetical protein